MKLYRYDYDELETTIKLTLRTFTVLRETPKGYWVVEFYTPSLQGWYYEKLKKWVSKTSRKRLCYPNKHEAFVSFKCRKQRQLKILTHQVRMVELACKLNKHDSTLGKPESLFFTFE